MTGEASDAIAAHRPLGQMALWGIGGLIAVGLHALVAVTLLQPVTADAADDDLGAPAMEIGIELAAPKIEATDLPPGPEADNSASSTASIAQPAVPDKTDLPQDKPVETEEPDRIVTPEKVVEPKEPDPKPKEERSEQSADSTPSEAAAPTTVETKREAPVSVAPTPGTGASTVKLRATWQRQLIVQLERNKRYPAGGARREVQILVSFTMERNGRLVSAEIAKSSGEPAFDEAALAMVRRASPLPPPPPLIADEGLTFTLPVIFRANRKG